MLKGVVFIDHNANGIYDLGDEGLCAVPVSNAKDVVLTNKKGQFKIKDIGSEFVMLAKPSGYRFKKDSLGYGLFYQRIDGNNKKQFNFPLYQSNEVKTVRSIIVGDPQMADKARLDFYRNGSVNHMMKQEADFFMVLGDIADDNPEILMQEKALMAQLKIDGYHVAGNHDVNYESLNQSTHFSSFKKTYGPDYYSFNYGKAHFVVLNNINYFGWDNESNKRGSYFGGMDEQQLTWLKNDLAIVSKDKLIVLNTHIPLLKDYMDTIAIAAIHKLLEPFDNILALSGHLHGVRAYNNDVTSLWNGAGKYESLVAGATCGSWWTGPYTEEGLPFATCMDGTPKGYFILEMEGAAYNYRFVPEHYSDDYQLRITILDKTDKQQETDDIEVIANWFTGKNADEVKMKVDNGNWVQMQNYKGESPLIKSTLAKRTNIDNWMPEIYQTEHLWKATLPKNLKMGYHTVYVQAKDQNGLIYNSQKVFEIR